MSQPQGDQFVHHSGLEKMHGRSVPDDVRRDFGPRQRWIVTVKATTWIEELSGRGREWAKKSASGPLSLPCERAQFSDSFGGPVSQEHARGRTQLDHTSRSSLISSATSPAWKPEPSSMERPSMNRTRAMSPRFNEPG